MPYHWSYYNQLNEAALSLKVAVDSTVDLRFEMVRMRKDSVGLGKAVVRRSDPVDCLVGGLLKANAEEERSPPVLVYANAKYFANPFCERYIKDNLETHSSTL